MKVVIVNKNRAIFSLVLIGLFLIWGVYISFFKFDVDKLLASSSLKNRTFVAQVVEIESKSGIKAYLFEEHTNPIISIDFIFEKQGYAYDENGEKGISNIASIMMTKGAGKLDNQAFKDELEEKAIDISFSAGLDDFSGNLTTTTQNQNRAYELLKMVIFQPRFDDVELALVKEQIAYSFKSQQENPKSILSLKTLEGLYDKHSYSDNFLGNIDNISKVSASKLKSFLQNRFSKQDLIVGISGDINPEQASAILDDLFASLKENRTNAEIENANLLFDGKNIKQNFKSAQNVANFISEGTNRKDMDFYPLYVVNYIFGGAGLNSRLSAIARENEGLTYGIYTYLANNDKSNLIQGSFSSTGKNFPRVVEIVEYEWDKMGKKGITDKELETAKKYLISSYNLRFASIGEISSMLVYMQKLQLGMDFLQKRNDYIRNISLTDANRVARKYFAGQQINWFSIGAFENELEK